MSLERSAASGFVTRPCAASVQRAPLLLHKRGCGQGTRHQPSVPLGMAPQLERVRRWRRGVISLTATEGLPNITPAGRQLRCFTQGRAFFVVSTRRYTSDTNQKELHLVPLPSVGRCVVNIILINIGIAVGEKPERRRVQRARCRLWRSWRGFRLPAHSGGPAHRPCARPRLH